MAEEENTLPETTPSTTRLRYLTTTTRPSGADHEGTERAPTAG